MFLPLNNRHELALAAIVIVISITRSYMYMVMPDILASRGFIMLAG